MLSKRTVHVANTHQSENLLSDFSNEMDAPCTLLFPWQYASAIRLALDLTYAKAIVIIENAAAAHASHRRPARPPSRNVKSSCPRVGEGVEPVTTTMGGFPTVGQPPPARNSA